MKMIKPNLTGRGAAMVVAAPTLFAASEVLYHVHPLVGLTIGGLAGIVAYRHWDDIEGGIETLKSGTIQQYEPRHEATTASARSGSGGEEGRRPPSRTATDQGQQGQPKDSEAIINQLIPIGKHNGKTFARSLKSFKNIIILGLPGGGKTNTAIHVIKHCVRNGARLAIIDKHARATDDSLSAKIALWHKAFICPVAGDPDRALSVIEAVRNVLDRRLDGEKPKYPLILVIDEYSAIMRQKEDGGKWQEAAEELAGLIEDTITEGRKCHVFCICIGQITNVSRTGGSEIRELFPTRIAHGMSAKQATLFGFGEQKNLLPALGKGEIFIQAEEMAEPIHLQVRYETGDDITAAATRIPDHKPLVVEDDEENEENEEDHLSPLTSVENTPKNAPESRNMAVKASKRQSIKGPHYDAILDAAEALQAKEKPLTLNAIAVQAGLNRNQYEEIENTVTYAGYDLVIGQGRPRGRE